MADLVELGHDNSGAVLVGSYRAGEAEPAHGLVLGLFRGRHIGQAQVGTGQGAQPLPGKVVDGDHNAPGGLQCNTAIVSNCPPCTLAK